MNPLLEAALHLQDLLDSWNWRFCVIGGIAVLRWGDARFTRDVDVSLLTEFGREDDYILPGCSLRTCSAEDLMVLKLFAFRPQDLVEEESLAVRRGKSLDWTYVLENLNPLAEAKGEPAIMNTLARLRRLYGGD